MVVGLATPSCLLPAGNNVLLDSAPGDSRGFVARVCDFGLARLANKGCIETRTLGTASHLAPEVLTHDLITPAAGWLVVALGRLGYQGHILWCGCAVEHLSCGATVLWSNCLVNLSLRIWGFEGSPSGPCG